MDFNALFSIDQNRHLPLSEFVYTGWSIDVFCGQFVTLNLLNLPALWGNGGNMELKEYTFLLQDNGSLKPIKNHLWQQILACRQPFLSHQSRSLRCAEISIRRGAHSVQRVGAVRMWDLDLNEQGYIENRAWQMLAAPAMSTELGKLFEVPVQGMAELLEAFISGIVEGAGIENTPLERSMQGFVEQLLAEPA